MYGGDGLREEAISSEVEDVVEASRIVREAGGELDLGCSPTWGRALLELVRIKHMFLFAHVSMPKVVRLENVSASESAAAISSIVVGLNTYRWYGSGGVSGRPCWSLY